MAWLMASAVADTPSHRLCTGSTRDVLPGAVPLLQTKAVPDLVAQALNSELDPEASLRCLQALAAADSRLQQTALDRLLPAALRQMPRQGSSEQQLAVWVQLTQAVEQLVLAGSPGGEESGQGAFRVAQAVLASASRAAEVQPQAADALARLTTAATAACTPELQLQLVSSSPALHVQARRGPAEHSELVRTLRPAGSQGQLAGRMLDRPTILLHCPPA